MVQDGKHGTGNGSALSCEEAGGLALNECSGCVAVVQRSQRGAAE